MLRNSKFFPLFITQFLGAFNDNIFKNALFLYIVFKSYSLGTFTSEDTIAIGGAIFIIPYFLFSAFAGSLADRLKKNEMIYYVKIWEVFVMTLGVIGFYYDHLTLLLITLFLMGAQSAFFGPLKYGVLPELVDKDDKLLQANALVEMGTFTGILLGTVLGGFLISLDSEVGKYYVSVVIITVAILGVFTSKKLPKLEVSNPKNYGFNLIKIHQNLFEICTRKKVTWISIIVCSWFWYLGASLLCLFPVYVKDTLQGTEGVATALLTIFSVGIGIGNMACERLAHKFSELKILKVSMLGMSLFLLDVFILGKPFAASSEIHELSFFFTQPFFIRLVIDLFGISFCGGLFIVPLYTALQKYSENNMVASVIAGNNIVNALFMTCASIALVILYKLNITKPQVYLYLSLLNFGICSIIYVLNKKEIDKRFS